MIIKKKNANIVKKQTTLNNKELEFENKIMPTQSVDAFSELETTKIVSNEEVSDIEIDDLDLTLKNIKFEQREERREGSRRRGYRRTQDRNIISRAQNEAIAIKEAAKQDGYDVGIKQAQEDLTALKDTIIDFLAYKDEVYEKVSACIMDIALEIAKKIIKKEVETDENTIMEIVNSVLEEVGDSENQITLKVRPNDVGIVKDKIPEIITEKGISAKISIIPSEDIEDGGVLVVTSNGIIDATIATQFKILEQALNNKEEN